MKRKKNVYFGAKQLKFLPSFLISTFPSYVRPMMYLSYQHSCPCIILPLNSMFLYGFGVSLRSFRIWLSSTLLCSVLWAALPLQVPTAHLPSLHTFLPDTCVLWPFPVFFLPCLPVSLACVAGPKSHSRAPPFLFSSMQEHSLELP